MLPKKINFFFSEKYLKKIKFPKIKNCIKDIFFLFSNKSKIMKYTKYGDQ